MNIPKFDIIMSYHGDNYETLAKALAVKRLTIHNKATGLSEFKASEIGILMQRWSLTPEQVIEIFIKESS